MDYKVKMTTKIPREIVKLLNINESTIFLTSFEDGQLVIEPINGEEWEEYDDFEDFYDNDINDDENEDCIDLEECACCPPFCLLCKRCILED